MKFVFVLCVLMWGGMGKSAATSYGSQGLEIEYQQPDGSKSRLRVIGDTYHARTETLDGYTVIFNPADQSYYYAKATADGEALESLGIKADQPAPEGLLKHQAVSAMAARRIAQANRDTLDVARSQQWQQRVQALRAIREQQAGLQAAPAPGDAFAAIAAQRMEIQAAPVNGAKVGLTILVQFPDVNFPTDQAKIQRYCNGLNYTEDGNIGSVRDYFADQSNNLLNYTQSVTQIVTLPNARNFYNYSDYPTNTTLRAQSDAGRLIIQAAVAALKTSGFDFSNLTIDANNKIVATNVLFAGSNSGVWSQGLWPHSSSMPTPIDVGTARYVDRYQITNIATATPVVGTFCHENGHLLCGFPDLYDKGNESSGLGFHCLMAEGNHVNGGRSPAPINLYLKDAVGWANIVNLTTNAEVTVALPSTGNVGRRLRKPGSLAEYFLVENRGAGDKWAANVPDNGICIWHIDEDKYGNDEQQMTVGSHYKVSLEQADGLFDLENDRDSGDGQDLFDSGDPDFSDSTTPNAQWWSGADSDFKIHVASPAGTTMNVQFGDFLAPNTILVKSPKGGEIFYSNSNVEITWGANLVGNVKIELLKGPVVQATLAANEANDKSYAWTVSPTLPLGSDYTVRVSSVNNPSYFDVSNAVFEIRGATTLADALDSTNLVWTSTGNAWFPQSITTKDGSDAAQSADISHSQDSRLSTKVTGPCTLAFSWKVSSEAFRDYLALYIDNSPQTGSLVKISGVVDWTQKTVQLPEARQYSLEWRYTKDSTGDGNLDTAWLDQVYIVTPPEIVVEQPVGTGLADNSGVISCGAALVGGSATTRIFTIRNSGSSDLTGLTVSKDGGHSADFAVSSLGAATLATGASTTFSVQFTAGALGTRNAGIHIASNDADENPFDIALTGTGVDSATWTNSAGGSWRVGTNWLNGVEGNGSGVTAHFETLALASNSVVTIDGARTIGGLMFGDTANKYSWTLAAGSGGSLMLAAPGTPEVQVVNQTATLGAVLSGNNGLIKTGAGNLTLTAANDYTGTTTISNGLLLVIGSLGNTATTVAAAGSLGGTGSLGGAVTNHGTLAPGNAAVGTLTINNDVTFSSTANVVMEVNKIGGTCTSDRIQGVTSLILDGTLNVIATGDTLATGDAFTLFSAGSTSGAFSAVNLPVLGTGLVWDTSKLATIGTISVKAVPLVALSTPVANADETGLVAGKFTITRSGSTVSELVVNFVLTGAATDGTDFASVGTSVTIPSGAATADVVITPLGDQLAEGNETAVLTLTNHAAYAIGTPFSGTVTIADLRMDSWRSANFGVEANNPAIAGDSADPDHDGVNNLLEYAVGGGPLDGRTRMPGLIAGSILSTFQLDLPDPLPADLDFTVEGVIDLEGIWAPIARNHTDNTWNWLGGGSSHLNVTSPIGGRRIVEVSTPDAAIAAPCYFLRLRVVRK